MAVPHLSENSCFMNSLAISIVHPAFENIKRLGRFLHLIAGLIILSNAIAEGLQPHLNHLYFWCQLIIGLDIIIMVFTNRNLVQELPLINSIFRLLESLVFLGAAVLSFSQGNGVMGILSIAISIAYGYLFYCERKTTAVEIVAFHHTGITISGIPSTKFFIWSHINAVEARYDSIIITTSHNKVFQFDLRKNLQFDELDQIHEFCRHYLGTAS
jgi:hypothetical protein